MHDTPDDAEIYPTRAQVRSNRQTGGAGADNSDISRHTHRSSFLHSRISIEALSTAKERTTFFQNRKGVIDGFADDQGCREEVTKGLHERWAFRMYIRCSGNSDCRRQSL